MLNGVPATVERIGERCNDRDLRRYWISLSGEWHDEVISIQPFGSNTYVSSVRGSQARFRTVVLSYSGHDSNGYPFSGFVSAELEIRSP